MIEYSEKDSAENPDLNLSPNIIRVLHQIHAVISWTAVACLASLTILWMLTQACQ